MLEKSEIIWDGNTPESVLFGDIYFSAGDGKSEKHFVFLDGNELPERWIGKDLHTVFEFGFGFGLNFILTWKLFLQTGTGRLDYFAAEKYPVSKDDLLKLRKVYPELESLYLSLAQHFPQLIPGYHRIVLDDKVTLTLLLGDVKETSQELCGQVNTWYLDGFAPAKNSAMWSGDVFRFMQQSSASSATFSTYSSAGFVKRGLEENGFVVRKKTGYGKKREMLCGYLQNADRKQNNKPWFSFGTAVFREKATVAVIGAGLAGTAVAEAFSRRGIAVSILDKNSPASGASGNPYGIFYPFLTASFSWYARFSLESFGYLHRHLSRLAVWHKPAGVSKLYLSENDRIKNQKARDIFGLTDEVVEFPDTDDAVFFPAGSVTSPPELCRKNLAGKQIQFIQADIQALEQIDNLWRLKNSAGQIVAEADIVVFANAYATGQFEQLAFIPMNQVKGQIAFVRQNEKSEKLENIICYDGYLLPQQDGYHVTGASYSENVGSMELEQSVSAELVAKANSFSGNVLDPLEITGGRVSFRAQSKDRFPVIGPVPDVAWYYENYKTYPYLKDKSGLPEGKCIPGLYLSVGHGSRGLLNCHLGAELLVCEILRESLPVEKSIAEELHPARFIMRNLKRQIFRNNLK